MGKHYLVLTGGSRGIGEATIAHFSKHHWTTINISRNPCQISNVINLQADLSDPTNLEKIAPQLRNLVTDAETICLIHNAVFQIGDTVQDMKIEDLMLTLNINLIASTVLNKMLIPLMKPGSSILYMGSMLADRGVPSNASYVISKHAVLGLMRSTCQDLRGKNISTCCICPGLVNTQLLKSSMSDDLIEHVLDNHVVGNRLINPEEIAGLLYSCAHSPIVNGALIPANLGLVAG